MKSKILISLVSKQTVPNVLFINEAKDVDEYWLVSTPQMKAETEMIIVASELAENMIKRIEVNAFSLTDIQGKLAQNIVDPEAEYIVNITGGTKMMSLGAYQFFEQFKSAKMVYLNIGDNSFQVISPSQEPSKNLSYPMGIKEYLACYGIKVASKRNRLIRPATFTQLFFTAFITDRFGKNFHRFLSDLRDDKWKNNKRISPDDIQKGMGKFLSDIQFLKSPDATINPREREYLIGGWLEEYVYAEIKQRTGCTDKHIAHSVQIQEGRAGNEIDVLFIKDNTPYIIECKTGLRMQGQFNRAVYLQSSFKEHFGIAVRPILFSLSNYHNKQGKLKQGYADRATQHDIRVIDKTMIMNGALDQLIKELSLTH